MYRATDRIWPFSKLDGWRCQNGGNENANPSTRASVGCWVRATASRYAPPKESANVTAITAVTATDLKDSDCTSDWRRIRR